MKRHLIWTLALVIGGFIGAILTQSQIVFGFYALGIVVGIVLGFRAVFFAFSKKKLKKEPTADEAFRAAFPERYNQPPKQ